MLKSIGMTAVIVSVLSTTSLFAKPAQTMKLTPKVVGGQNAAHGEFPFIVSLRSGSFGHFCGGSLVASNWVLTAAHCVKGGSVDEVWIGLLNQNDQAGVEKMKVTKIIAHQDYDSNSMENDFALIQLDKNSSYKPISLNEKELLVMSANTQIMATTAGWGALREGSYGLPNALQKVEVPLVSQAACNDKTAYNGDIKDTMLCAGYKQGGKDSCQGDSGGPLVTRDQNGEFTLIGVVSWGEGCARANKYGVYAKVSSAISWVKATAQF